MDEPARNERLVRDIASGGIGAPNAEAELCRIFSPRAERYGRKHLRDTDGARDLAQSAMLAVLEAARAGRILDGGLLDRFVLGTCRNISMRMRQLDARANGASATDLDAFAAASEDVDALANRSLLRCLRALEPRTRTVVHLSFNEDKSAEEIAVVVDTTAGNVRVIRHRAVAHLRRCLDGPLDEKVVLVA
jgi:RNA polymerase sigma-70 factor (ECF subfamily)